MISQKNNLIMNLGLGVSFVGIALYDPLGLLFTGMGLIFVGIGLFLFGVFFLGNILKGVGALVGTIGIGQIIAGYLYPNTSEELRSAVEDFEKK